ncbi:MAG: hypothetical protein KGY41_02890 [Desulfovermiculus sp.]|nr:hypothetical protein [Desulfovermiculus sp.]
MIPSRILQWATATWKKIFSSSENRLENELIKLTRKDVAQRLIALEERKNPRASRKTCIENALRRLKRDRK